MTAHRGRRTGSSRSCGEAHELTAVDPQGRVRWSLPGPERIRVARRAPGDGFLVAYLAGPSLRIVAGDGTGDRAYRAARADVAPAWRPGSEHVLAYVEARGRVNVDAVDTGRRLWRTSRTLPPSAQLLWSAGGEFLLVLARRRAELFDGAGRLRRATPARSGFGAEHAVWAPRDTRVAVVRVNRAKRLSEVAVLDAGRGGERVIFARPGRYGAPAWSPDGRLLLLPWPEADQWLFLRPDGGARRSAVANIARQFDSGTDTPAFPRTVQVLSLMAYGVVNTTAVCHGSRTRKPPPPWPSAFRPAASTRARTSST